MIPFYRPWFDHRELAAALALYSARSKLEATLAQRAGVRYGIAFAYGHAGLIAGLRALEIEHAHVIIPAYTCAILARAVVASGNLPVFCDIDLADFNMDFGALKRALTVQARVIVATHTFGYPIDVEAIRSATGDRRILIIEDSAQSLHTLSEQGNGLRGDIGLYSFGIGKPLSTCKGGMLLTDSAELYERIKTYRDKAMDRRSVRSEVKRWVWFLTTYLAFRKWSYPLWHPQGRSEVLDNTEANKSADTIPEDYATQYLEFQARVGLVQVSKVNQMLARRRALAELYQRELEHVRDLVPAPVIPGASYSYYSVRVPRRNELDIKREMRARGVAVDQTFDYALPCLPPFRSLAKGAFPRAEQAAREIVNLPIYPDLDVPSALHVTDAMRQTLE